MIVGVSAKAQSGKGEFAAIAASEFNATIVSFASGVKEEVAEWLDSTHVAWRKDNLYGSNEDKEAWLRVRHSFVKGTPMFDFAATYGDYSSEHWYFNARSLMQWWGTEYRRNQDPEYWVKKAMQKCTGYRRYVIDDVRFPNEFAAIKNSGGRLVRVERPNIPVVSNSNHPSETALDDYNGWHFKITNDGYLGEYKEKVRKVLEEIFGVH